MVAGDDEHVRSGSTHADQEPVHELLRLGRRVPAFEDVSRVEDEVDGFPFDEGREMLEHSLQLVEALNPLPSAADMPVAGVDDPHSPGSYPANCRRRPATATVISNAVTSRATGPAYPRVPLPCDPPPP